MRTESFTTTYLYNSKPFGHKAVDFLNRPFYKLVNGKIISLLGKKDDPKGKLFGFHEEKGYKTSFGKKILWALVCLVALPILLVTLPIKKWGQSHVSIRNELFRLKHTFAIRQREHKNKAATIITKNARSFLAWRKKNPKPTFFSKAMGTLSHAASSVVTSAGSMVKDMMPSRATVARVGCEFVTKELSKAMIIGLALLTNVDTSTALEACKLDRMVNSDLY